MDSKRFSIPPSPPSNAAADPDLGWQHSLLLVCAALLAAALPVPWLAGRLSSADLLFLLSFALLAVFLLRRNRRILFPIAIPFFLFLYGLSAVANPGAGQSLAELGQRFLQLFAGVAVLSWLMGWRPYWALTTLSAAVAFSTTTALLQWSTGTPYAELHGFFPSRISFCTFQVLLLLWCFPQWFNLNVLPRTRMLSILAATLVLLPVSHGQLMAGGGLLLILTAGITDRMAFWGGVAALLLTLLLLAALPGRNDRLNGLASSLSPFENGQVKQAHIETVAACRMAVQNPWFGVGPANYQTNVGAYYGTLPNPNEQSIEPGHQAGWSILAGSAGIPAAAVLFGALLVASVSVFRNFRAPRNARERQFLGGASAALAIILLGWITDPFVRGNGWLVALSFACLCGMHGGQVRELGWRGLALAMVIALLPLGGIAARMVLPEPGTTEGPEIVDLTWREGTSGDAQGPALAEDPEVDSVLSASDATRVLPPMQRRAKEGIPLALVLPEGAGKPPPNRAPALTDGGAVFPLPDTLTAGKNYSVWLYTFWDDGCGNSMFVRLNGGTPRVVGNDGTYQRWHWVKVPGTLQAKRGSEVVVLNREDGAAVSHILFSSSAEYVPARSP